MQHRTIKIVGTGNRVRIRQSDKNFVGLTDYLGPKNLDYERRLPESGHVAAFDNGAPRQGAGDRA